MEIVNTSSSCSLTVGGHTFIDQPSVFLSLRVPGHYDPHITKRKLEACNLRLAVNAQEQAISLKSVIINANFQVPALVTD